MNSSRVRGLLGVVLMVCGVGVATAQTPPPAALADTKPWPVDGDPSTQMVEGIHKFLDRETARARIERGKLWQLNYSSRAAFEKSQEPHRARLAKLIGVERERNANANASRLEYVGTRDQPAKLAETKFYTVYAVRWAVYDDFSASGYLVEPKGPVQANIVALSHSDVMSEQFLGLIDPVLASGCVPLFLAEAGCRVLVPIMLSRDHGLMVDKIAGPVLEPTNIPSREWIWRQAYEAGRSVIGYEVDEVRAAVDWFVKNGQARGEPSRPIGVMGHGEGGLIALCAAALDTRINVGWVAGYFGPRAAGWKEPIDRMIWGQARAFDDVDLATLVMPRRLIVEWCPVDTYRGAPVLPAARSCAASGMLEQVPRADAEREFARLKTRVAPLDAWPSDVEKDRPRVSFVVSEGILNQYGVALRRFLESLSIDPGQVGAARHADALEPPPPGIEPRSVPTPGRALADKLVREKLLSLQRREQVVLQLEAHTQKLLRTSHLRRDAYWKKADRSSVDSWTNSTKRYRDDFYDQVIGRLPEPNVPLDVVSRKDFETARYVGYRVKIPVYPDVFASGVLLLPKDLRPGERRPVVVCRHGLEGRADDVVNPAIKSVYNAFGAQLADRGYIVFAPQTPYIGHDRFRQLIRKAHPLGWSLYGVVVRQDERTIAWLKTLPGVDPARIAHYGLSYGGKVAMRIPAVVPDYCLSICSGDFNDWVRKCTDVESRYSYMYTQEYDMYEFGLAEQFNYAEIADLIAPRPFMVERGHDDGVAPDEWVAAEFAKVRRLYDKLGIGDRAELAFFNGGHQIDGRATFAFLAKHLNWPRGATKP